MGVDSLRIYLDSCIVIYLVEEHPAYSEPIRQTIAAIGDAQFCISPLVELECMVVPLRLANTELQLEYEQFFARMVQLHIPADLYRTAAGLRATHNLRTPDALHLAVAQHYGCTQFWTNDDRLTKVAPGQAINITAK